MEKQEPQSTWGSLLQAPAIFCLPARDLPGANAHFDSTCTLMPLREARALAHNRESIGQEKPEMENRN